MRPYGSELILDLHGCDLSVFTETHLQAYIDSACEMAKVHRHDKSLVWIDNSGNPILSGVSVFQFISTSNITIHACDLLQAVYINFFACSDFNADEIAEFSKQHFRAKEMTKTLVTRG